MPRATRADRTTAVDILSASVAQMFGTQIKWTTMDLTGKVELTSPKLRGAINHMHCEGMLSKAGTCPKTGLGTWILTKRGLSRAKRVVLRKGY